MPWAGRVPGGFSHDALQRPLDVNGTFVPFAVMSVSVLPGEEVRVRRAGGSTGGAAGGEELWEGAAPTEPGIYGFRLDLPDGAPVHLNVMVLHPATDAKDGRLHGYEIGRYGVPQPGMGSAYDPPAGFVAVSPEDEDILASPHFTLGQFLCKQPGDPPFEAVSPALLIKLEHLLAAVREAGYPVETLAVMSGFRTPAHNRRIGNTTTYSRHLWGDAADVYVDGDGDGDMDDLNGDGRSDIADARLLAKIAEGVTPGPGSGLIPGGLAAYRRNSAHGPFVHLDTRGKRARW